MNDGPFRLRYDTTTNTLSITDKEQNILFNVINFKAAGSDTYIPYTLDLDNLELTSIEKKVTYKEELEVNYEKDVVTKAAGKLDIELQDAMSIKSKNGDELYTILATVLEALGNESSLDNTDDYKDSLEKIKGFQ